jgi:hypothetical protein
MTSYRLDLLDLAFEDLDMLITNLTAGKRLKMPCRICKVKTNHELLAVYHQQHVVDEDDDGRPIFWEDIESRFWICLGCEAASLEEVWWPEGIKDVGSSTFYPRNSSNDRAIKDFVQLDKKLQQVYKEVILSFNEKLLMLCAMGLRALLEAICINKGINDSVAWGLEAKLQKLEEEQHLPSNIVEGLHSFKFIGDSAVHRLEAPTVSELSLAIDMVEDLLNFMFELRYKMDSNAQKLKGLRPQEMAKLQQKKSSKKSLKYL